MANGNDLFSMSIKQENQTVPPPPPPRGTPTATPPPPRDTNLAVDKNQSLVNSVRFTSTPQETETCLRSLTNVMTSDDDAPFQEVISNLNGSELQRMAALLTSDNDRYFFVIARTKNGSIRLQKLLGKSYDADIFFAASILRHFRHAMTDEHASRVGTRAMRVVSNHQKRMAMRDQLLHHAVHLACDRYGSVALNAIIRDVGFLYCSTALMDAVSYNALLLSNDAYGSLVVQHVLKHCSSHSTRNIGFSLRGHCVELSFTGSGRCIVERLLERYETDVLVMTELLECGNDNLVRLARSEYGRFVVEKALKVARVDLFGGLVNKLKPFLPLLSTSPQSTTNIAEIVESFVTKTS